MILNSILRQQRKLNKQLKSLNSARGELNQARRKLDEQIQAVINSLEENRLLIEYAAITGQDPVAAKLGLSITEIKDVIQSHYDMVNYPILDQSITISGTGLTSQLHCPSTFSSSGPVVSTVAPNKIAPKP
jgi:hypothetical protein